jgi:hypothetical protein
VIEPIDDVFGLVGQEIVVVPTISDPEGDEYTITWDGGPPNAVINGIYVLTPTEEQGGSVYELTVTATQVDDPSLASSTTFRVFVAELPAGPVAPADVDPFQVFPGDTVQVRGDGFLPGSKAGVYLFSDPVLLGTATVDRRWGPRRRGDRSRRCDRRYPPDRRRRRRRRRRAAGTRNRPRRVPGQRWGRAA